MRLRTLLAVSMENLVSFASGDQRVNIQRPVAVAARKLREKDGFKLSNLLKMAVKISRVVFIVEGGDSPVRRRLSRRSPI